MFIWTLRIVRFGIEIWEGVEEATNTRFLVEERALFAPYVTAYKTYHCPADESMKAHKAVR